MFTFPDLPAELANPEGAPVSAPLLRPRVNLDPLRGCTICATLGTNTAETRITRSSSAASALHPTQGHG